MEELLPRVKNAEARSDYTILITFQNGERKEYDVKPLLQYPMYRNLEKVFPAAAVQFGTVVWPGDLDISPDTLYMNGKPVNDIGDGSAVTVPSVTFQQAEDGSMSAIPQRGKKTARAAQ